jgi:hypothetical protein
MSIDISTVAPKTHKTRTRKSGETRASQELHVARFQNQIYLVTKDKEAAEAEAEKHDGAEVFTYGSRRSLPIEVLVETLKASSDLADYHVRLGGKFGTRSQNDAMRDALATQLRETFDAINLRRKQARKDPVAYPVVNEGKWVEVATTTQKQMDADTLDYLNSLE